MKADIAYNFALGTSYESGFVGLTGVPSYSQFERALEELNSIGVVRINIMVDSDYQVKEEVRRRVIAISKWGLLLALRWLRLPGHKSEKA